MAHSSRPHPYRATSRVDTPQGPRTAAWLAGHRGLPGDVDPPPYRPVLILVDYSPLQGLTHRSEPDRDLYMALANSNFKNVVQENLKLFLPGHVSWNQSKQAFFPFETYVPLSQQD